MVRTRKNIKSTGIKIKELIFGEDPGDQKFMLAIYIVASVIYFVIAVPLMLGAAMVARVNNVPQSSNVLKAVFFYFFFMAMCRLILAAVKSARAFYIGTNTEERQGDDFSDIEALVLRGEFDKAIGELRREYRERQGKDDRPLLRIAEIYRLEMKDYSAAINEYARIVRTIETEGTKMQAYAYMLEIYRDRLPDAPEYDGLCKKVAKEYPNSIAGRLAIDHLLTKGIFKKPVKND